MTARRTTSPVRRMGTSMRMAGAESSRSAADLRVSPWDTRGFTIVSVPPPASDLEEPEGDNYGGFAIYRVTHETRHLCLHENCQRERGRSDPRPETGGSSCNPSAEGAWGGPRRSPPARRHG